MSSTTSIAEGAQTAAELPVLRPCQPFQKRLLTTLSCDNEIRNILWACQETPDDMTPEVERILAQRSRVILISIWKQAAPNPLSFDFLHIFRTYNTQQLVQDILAAVKNPTKFGTIETWESTFQARIDRIRLRELVNVTYGVDTKVFGSLEELCREMWLCKSSLGGFARRVKAIQGRTNSLAMRFIDCSISSTFPGPVIAQSLFKPVLRAVSKICKAESTLSADQMEYLDLQYHSWIRHDTGLIERFEQVLELLRTLRNQGAYGAHCLLIVCPGLIPPEHLAECFSLFSCIPGLNEQVMMLESLRQQATQPAWPANEQLLYQPITL